MWNESFYFLSLIFVISTLLSSSYCYPYGGLTEFMLHPLEQKPKTHLESKDITAYRKEVVTTTGEVRGTYTWLFPNGSPQTISYSTAPAPYFIAGRYPEMTKENDSGKVSKDPNAASSESPLKIFRLEENLNARNSDYGDIVVVSAPGKAELEDDDEIFFEDLIPDTTTEKEQEMSNLEGPDSVRLPSELEQLISAATGRPVAVSKPLAAASAGSGGAANASPQSSAVAGFGGLAISFPQAQASIGPQGVAVSNPVSVSQSGMGGISIAGGQSMAIAGTQTGTFNSRNATEPLPSIAVYPVIANYFFGVPFSSQFRQGLRMGQPGANKKRKNS